MKVQLEEVGAMSHNKSNKYTFFNKESIIGEERGLSMKS